jgi:molecular chaperone DnaJ
MKRCYYDVLGLSKGCSCDEVRKAYKREALKHHPDRNQGDCAAEAKFKEVNEAYQVLSDDQKRVVYDQFGHEGLEANRGGGFDPGDMFSQMGDLFSEIFSGGMGGFGFGGQKKKKSKRGADLRIQERITLREAAFGCKREVSVQTPQACGDCAGSGAKPGTQPEGCGQCGGSGQVSSARGFVVFTSPCGKCRGQGTVIRHPCKTCSGHGIVEKTRKVVVSFPPGIDSGVRLRVPGQGVSVQGLPSGDLYVDVEVEDDPRFERDGADLVTRVHVSFAEATLGAEVPVQCLAEEGTVEVPLELPPGTQPNTVITMKGQGVPRLDGRGRGSLAVIVEVDVPLALTERGKELLDQLAEELKTCAAAKRKR